MNRFDQALSGGMWRVIFYERKGNRVQMDRTGPWLPDQKMARQWAQWFGARGHHVALQDQTGALERLSAGLPG